MNIYPLLFMAQSFACVLACVYCYALGAKHGRIVRDDGIPHVQGPVEAVKAAVQEAKEQKTVEKQADAVENFMSITRESMLESIDEQRRSGKRAVK